MCGLPPILDPVIAHRHEPLLTPFPSHLAPCPRPYYLGSDAKAPFPALHTSPAPALRGVPPSQAAVVLHHPGAPTGHVKGAAHLSGWWNQLDGPDCRSSPALQADIIHRGWIQPKWPPRVAPLTSFSQESNRPRRPPARRIPGRRDQTCGKEPKRVVLVSRDISELLPRLAASMRSTNSMPCLKHAEGDASSAMRANRLATIASSPRDCVRATINASPSRSPSAPSITQVSSAIRSTPSSLPRLWSALSYRFPTPNPPPPRGHSLPSPRNLRP